VDDITTAQRWVATDESARQAAGAFLQLLVRRPWWWGVVAAVEVGYAALIGLTIEDGYSPLERALWGAVFALVPTICVVVLVLGLSHLVNRRRFRERIHAGVVLESSIGQHALNLRSPWAEHVLLFEGLSNVRSSGDWVFLKQKGVPIWGVWPAELFPPGDLARLQRSIAGDKS
jgi:hypothetical protein